MKLIGWQTMIGAGLAMLIGDGCRQPPPPPPPPPPPVWEVPADRPAQVSELTARIAALNQAIEKLPGKSQEEHQQIAVEVLDNLSKILRLAQGSAVNPQFMNRIHLVNDSKAVLARTDMEPTRAEASENEAMRAALDILEPVAARDEPKDVELGEWFNGVRAKLDAMYSATGPMHDLAAKDGFAALSKLLGRMNEDLTSEFGTAAASS
jgi:hypothetical protein